MERMQAATDFENSLEELNYLIESAHHDSKNDKVFFKSIVLLLCAKLERYVKNSTKEFIKQLLDMELPSEKLPREFLNEIIKNEIEIINRTTVEKYIGNELKKDRAKVFSAIWNKKYVLKNLNDDEFTVSISNNGTTAFENVYKKIGFSDIIKGLKDYESVTDVGGLQTATLFPIPDTINKVIRIRHNIIHEDATPPITISDIELYLNIFKSFVKQIDMILCCEIINLKGESL